MINDEKKWQIERIVNTCKGVCEIGTLLHELWRAYRELEDYIKIHEANVWARIQKERENENKS